MARGRKANSPKEMKRANGTGCIRKLSGNRRKPWQVMITVGTHFDEKKGKAIQEVKQLGTYKTREDAEKALLEFNDNPFDYNASTITFGEIYEIWSEKKYLNLSKSTVASYKSAYKYCLPIADCKIRDLKTMHLQQIIDSCLAGSNTKTNIKVVMSAIFDYAEKNDMVSKNYAKFVEFEYSEPVLDQVPFSVKEIEKLKSMDNDWYVRVVLILLYTGMRVNELLKMPSDCCHLEEGYLDIKKAKNKFSVRKVPIHSAIKKYIEDFYSRESRLLICNEGGYDILYNNFATRQFKDILKKLDCEHHIHDARHTFISHARMCNFNELYLKLIVGHAPSDITSKVYTHIDFPLLQKEIEKLSYQEHT